MFKVMFENWNNSVITVFEGTFEECVKHGKKVVALVQGSEESTH